MKNKGERWSLQTETNEGPDAGTGSGTNRMMTTDRDMKTLDSL